MVSALGNWLDKKISSDEEKHNGFHLRYVDLKYQCEHVE